MDNIYDSINFNILEAEQIKTNKLDYSNKKNVIYINKNNCSNIILNHKYTNTVLITQDSDMDIHINLTSTKIGTKFKLLLTNIQKSLKIETLIESDKIIGEYKLNNNSSIENEISIENKLKKRKINKSNKEGNNIIYIPDYKLGLYNGGYLELVYIGDIYCNLSNTNTNNWLIDGNLIGDIIVPKYIKKNDNCVLTLYISLKENNNIENKILYVTTKINDVVYFNKVDNNNIILFLNLNYRLKLINVIDNTVLYDSSITTTQLYNISVKSDNNTFISLTDMNNTLDLGNINNNITNIKPLYNIQTNQLYNIENNNILEYKIQKIIDQTNIELLQDVYLNIIDLNAYYNEITDYSTSVLKEINNESIIFDIYNGFTEKTNKIDENIIK